MFCRKCGAQVDDQAAFCDKCGTALDRPIPDMGTTPTPQAVLYAGLEKRIVAAFIDGAMFTGMQIIVYAVLIATGVIGMSDFWAGEDTPEYAHFTMVNLVVSPAFLLAYWAYFAIMESSSKQATLGKMAMGIVVTDKNGRRISFGRAVGRNLGKIISGIILYIGYLMIAFTEKKQGLHDMMAGCVVVVKKK